MASSSSSKVRLAGRAAHSATARVSARRLHASTSILDSTSSSSPAARSEPSEAEPLTGSSKLLAEALRLEAEEEALVSRNARKQDPNDAIWTGEERLQDTVLRLVMDKYKPLRLAVDPGKDPADEKIKAGIQTPTAPASLASSVSCANDDDDDGGGGGGFQLFAPPGVEGSHEDGRKLPKTPDQKPWRAVYVRPAHLLGGKAEEAFQPSIYYGQFLKSGAAGGGVAGGGSSSSDLRAKLKAAGVNVAALPTDDAKAMKQLRQGTKVAERREKLLRARDSVLDYQLSQQSNSTASTTPAEENYAQAKGDTVSDTNRNLQLQLGHAQGWDSVIEKRIKAALDSGAFKENKLRGKPIQRDMEEKNPFLAREEYFMNRIVKRQGAAPPWVELNMELEAEVRSWKQRLDDGWIRRASRMITTSTTLGSGIEGLPLHATVRGGAGGQEKPAMPQASTPGEEKLVQVATRYRDAEWEERERAYHTLELKRLNDLIRKHNHLAPFTARKGLMMLDLELANMYTRTLPKLVYEVSSILHAKTAPGRSGGGQRVDGWDDSLHKEQTVDGGVRYDMWGREIRNRKVGGAGGEAKGWLDGWWGNGVAGGSADGGGGGGDGSARGVDGSKQAEVQRLGLLAAIRKSLHWARQRIVGAAQ